MAPGRVRRLSLIAAVAAALIVGIAGPAVSALPQRPPASRPHAPAARPTSTSPSPAGTGYATAAEAGAAGKSLSGRARCQGDPSAGDALQVEAPTVAVFTYVCGGGTAERNYLDVWVDLQGGAWHVYTWAPDATRGPQGPDGVWMGEQPVEVAGGWCARVYAAPGLSGPIVRCLGPSDSVVWASPHHAPWAPPVWADGTIWWYVFLDENGEGQAPTPLGWMDASLLICGDGPRDLATTCDQKVSRHGYATAQEAGDAAARVTGTVVDPNAYPGTDVVTGTGMAVFVYPVGPNRTGEAGQHSRLWVYVDEQGGRWHPYAWVSSLTGSVPGAGPGPVRIKVGSGCAGLRSSPSSSAAVIACLPRTQRVLTARPDGQPWKPPVWDGKTLWWYVTTTGDNNGSPQGLDPPSGWVALRHLVCGQGPGGPLCG